VLEGPRGTRGLPGTGQTTGLARLRPAHAHSRRHRGTLCRVAPHTARVPLFKAARHAAGPALRKRSPFVLLPLHTLPIPPPGFCDGRQPQ
jgi:hypothetical protein